MGCGLLSAIEDHCSHPDAKYRHCAQTCPDTSLLLQGKIRSLQLFHRVVAQAVLPVKLAPYLPRASSADQPASLPEANAVPATQSLAPSLRCGPPPNREPRLCAALTLAQPIFVGQQVCQPCVEQPKVSCKCVMICLLPGFYADRFEEHEVLTLTSNNHMSDGLACSKHLQPKLDLADISSMLQSCSNGHLQTSKSSTGCGAHVAFSVRVAQLLPWQHIPASHNLQSH